MAQAVMETIFATGYLCVVLALGLFLAARGKGGALTRKLGWMAVVLGVGDAFLLIPQALSHWGNGLRHGGEFLGAGRLVAALGATLFFLIPYHIWRDRCQVVGLHHLTVAVWGLGLLRAGLCLLPWNKWANPIPPLAPAVWRCVPLALMAALLLVLIHYSARRRDDRTLRVLVPALGLALACQIPTELLAGRHPMASLLLIPRAAACGWILWGGLRLHRIGELESRGCRIISGA